MPGREIEIGDAIGAADFAHARRGVNLANFRVGRKARGTINFVNFPLVEVQDVTLAAAAFALPPGATARRYIPPATSRN